MEDALKKLTLSVWEMLNAIKGLDGVPVADRPVSLADADLFNVGGNWLSDGEISKARRELADAISAEKWMQGAQTAIKLLKLLA
jgi:hypothetical protein